MPILLLAIGMLTGSCQQKNTLFTLVSSSHSGIHFTNQVDENEKYNVLDYMNLYTGAGVAAGDVNNDGLIDLYFSGNQTTSRLYINKGDLKFEDVTEKAGLLTNRWCTGVSMVDINGDGWMDMYVNVAGSAKFGDRHNLLYINNHNGTFSEKAAQWGIAEEQQTMNASFFDYDKDGDLDLFLITNPADEMVTGVNSIHERMVHGESAGTDILYRNNGNETFTDVSKEAGILIEGYSLGAAISDVNSDGWPDIYVSNDFLTNDILYINNGNGTFSDKTAECLKHTSFASMGNDVADFNNDGLPDIYTLDMLPEDNYRKKMIIPPASYDKFTLSLQKGYNPQYTRNALQLNNGNGSFSDIAFLSGVSSTDWSWSALWADYDNDGDKDLMVTNGFYRDLGNLDYINYQTRLQNPMGRQNARRAEKLKAIKKLETVPLQNYLFENNNNLTFTKRSDDWGFVQKGFSNGACYADLDNDGDLDLVINCFNSEARVYQNHTETLRKTNFLNITLEGKAPNIQGIGAKLWVYSNGAMQFQELNPYRGYESSVQPTLHFGLGNASKADSIKIVWPDGAQQLVYDVPANRSKTFRYSEHEDLKKLASTMEQKTKLFTSISGTLGLLYTHQEPEFVDFKVQPLLPHMFSKNGPGIAVGDVNNDGKDDFFIGGTAARDGAFFMQQKDGQFVQQLLPEKAAADAMGVLLFDADSDGDLDLYCVNGGSESSLNSSNYQDAFFQNNGHGLFKKLDGALPELRSSGSCVVAADYDHDGDLDLFVGGRVSPGNYPLAPRSYLLRNDSKNGICKFTDVTTQLCKEVANIGMVTSALWTDYDNDGWSDLMLVGEFMPVTFIHNNGGNTFSKPHALENSSGWWNSLIAADFDHDGDMDYIAGNLGLNSRHKASPQQPLCIYAKDYDKNGLLDPVMCYYVDGKNYIYPTRDEMIKQINPMRGRFPAYADYAKVTFDESFLPTELADAQVVKSVCFESSYIENKGGGQFMRKALPMQAQVAPIFGLLCGDYNGDGTIDVLLAGNNYATEASTGRYDALTGLLLAGDGRGNFAPQTSAYTGFTADGDVKSLAELPTSGGRTLILVGNNSGALQSFEWQQQAKMIPVKKDDVYAIVHLKNGKNYRQEFYWGSNYLSQTARNLSVSHDATSVTLFTTQNNKREVLLQQP